MAATPRIEDGIVIFGDPDKATVDQIRRCAAPEETAGAVLCADAHKGYSMPIGGVVAYRGLVSPSGVGFDIACIARGSLITTADGRRVPIEHALDAGNLLGLDERSLADMGAALAVKSRIAESTMTISTESGDHITLTGDHLLLTPGGWRQAGRLAPGDAVAISSFTGVQSGPQGAISQADWRLVQLLGYAMGDGHLPMQRKQRHRVCFYTSSDEDAAGIARDLRALGVEPSVTRRVRPGGIVANDVHCTAPRLREFMEDMGLRPGRAWQQSDLAEILRLSPHLRGAWLGGLFSAELATPRSFAHSVPNPHLKQGGMSPLPLLQCVAHLLADCGFQTRIASSGPPYNGHRTCILAVLGGWREAVRLWRSFGFPYARYKQRAAARAMSVCWQRDGTVEHRQETRAICRRLWAAGVGVHDIAARASLALGAPVTHPMALKALYEARRQPRVPPGAVIQPLCDGEIIWSRIKAIRFSQAATPVYDVALAHPGHNFVAEGFIVHNCGNKAVRTDLRAAEVRPDLVRLMDRISREVSFGIGRKNPRPVDHDLFDDPAWEAHRGVGALKKLARDQLGTVGAGNHYVDLLEEPATGHLWVAVHFGSRGFGHKTASGFLNLAAGRPFDAPIKGESMDHPPTLLRLASELGQAYMEAMRLAGRYAYAGRDHVVEQVLRILGARPTLEVHNHHNFSWREIHDGQDLIVVRKGATPCHPGQISFIGGSMADISVVVRGKDTALARRSLYSTVHGAGRIMSRTQAAGKWKRVKRGRVRVGGAVSLDEMLRQVREYGVELRGGGADEAPMVYRRLQEVLDAHSETMDVLHVLRPIGVAMAPADEFDPYKD